MNDFNRTTTRRDFVRFLCVLTVGFLIPHAADGAEIRRLLENEDSEGFNVRFIKPIEPVDRFAWKLRVGGLCGKPSAFGLPDLKALPKAVQTSRLKCVECWSGKAKWGGFRAKDLFEIVKPAKEALYVHFESADDYYEYIPITDLLHGRALFAYEMNEAPLPDIHGAPLRLVMPSKYGYKSVKTITKMTFLREGATGYWEQFGYSAEGTIQPGIDNALDLKEYRKITRPGEPDY